MSVSETYDGHINNTEGCKEDSFAVPFSFMDADLAEDGRLSYVDPNH